MKTLFKVVTLQKQKELGILSKNFEYDTLYILWYMPPSSLELLGPTTSQFSNQKRIDSLMWVIHKRCL